MQRTLNKLAEWLQVKVRFTPTEYDFFKNGHSFYITEEGTDEPFAVCTIDSSGNLVNLDYTDPELFETGELAADNMPQAAEAFIREFYPEGLKAYRLQSVIDLDDIFLVEYGMQDGRYGLNLPGIGFSLTITTSGKIVQFSFDEGPADIRYPDWMISEEEAKKAYVAHTDFELEIRKTDKELFFNGDNTFRLVWSLKEAAVDIPADGGQPDSVAEGREYEALPKLDVTDSKFHDLIGITKQHVKIGELSDSGLRIEKWQHSLLDTSDEIDFSDAFALDMITIHYDSENRPVTVYNGEEWGGSKERLNEEQLKQRAFDFLYGLYPDAQGCFWLEKEEPEIDWDEQEELVDELSEELDELEDEDDDEWMEDGEEWIDGPDESEEEESKAFYFQYQLNGVPVEGCMLTVQVGVFSGRIVMFSAEPIEEMPPADSRTVPVLTKQEAADRLMQQLHMELSMAMEFNEDGAVYYRLTYLPSFPETNGHVRMIDAENGTAYYMDVGGSVFF